MGVETGDGPPGLGMERVAADTRTVPGQLSPQVRRDINDRIKTAAPSPRSALIMVATGDGPQGWEWRESRRIRERFQAMRVAIVSLRRVNCHVSDIAHNVGGDVQRVLQAWRC